jgi:hypothetical protein
LVSAIDGALITNLILPQKPVSIMSRMYFSAHDIALFNLLGCLLAILGSMYWAYELLGGQKGPMNVLTRTVSYGLMFGVGYGLFLGPAFGIIGGIGFGMILSLENLRVVRHQRLYGSSPLHNTPWFGMARGVVIGLSSIPRYGWQFGALLGFFSSITLYVIYWRGYAPTSDYRSHTRPVITKHRLKASLYRGIAIGISGTLAGSILMDGFTSVLFGAYVGFSAALMSFLVGTFSPLVEYWADNLPERQVAAAGVMVMLLGMVLQSFQYVCVLMNWPIR